MSGHRAREKGRACMCVRENRGWGERTRERRGDEMNSVDQSQKKEIQHVCVCILYVCICDLMCVRVCACACTVVRECSVLQL